MCCVCVCVCMCSVVDSKETTSHCRAHSRLSTAPESATHNWRAIILRTVTEDMNAHHATKHTHTHTHTPRRRQRVNLHPANVPVQVGYRLWYRVSGPSTDERSCRRRNESMRWRNGLGGTLKAYRHRRRRGRVQQSTSLSWRERTKEFDQLSFVGTEDLTETRVQCMIRCGVWRGDACRGGMFHR
jgi:hypothetical protein